MNKEPLGMYIFRVIIGIGLLVFMYMLYWSSEIIEEDMREVKSELAEIKDGVTTLRIDTGKMRQNVINSQQDLNQKNSDIDLKRLDGRSNPEAQHNPLMDPSLPNLLKEDPFYEKTLPNLLGPNFKPVGTFHSATIGKPDNLHPFNNWAFVANWVGLCSVSVSTQLFGIYETMSPDMAIKLEERKRKGTDIPEYWVFLRDGVFWQPLSNELFTQNMHLAPHFLKKHQVTAHDFKFYIDALMNPYFQAHGATALRDYLGDIEEIEVLDDLTFVVRWKTQDFKEADGKVVPKVKYTAKLLTGSLTPLASFVYKYFPDGKKIIENDEDPNTYRTNSVWAQNFTEHWAKNIIVSCGRWIFDGMTDRQISFRRNPDFYNPYGALAEGMIYSFKNSPENIWQDFKEGKLDTYNVLPTQMVELQEFLRSPIYQKQVEKGLAIKQLLYFDRSYTYIGWNEARVFFKSPKVRRALTMAIDRQRIIQQNLNGMGIEIHGTFFDLSKATDPDIEPWPYDPEAAKLLLQEEGWYDSDGDGIIDKTIDGKNVKFRFKLTYYVKNPTTKAISEYVSTAFKEIGIDCKLNGVDIADLSAIFDDKNFDALCLAWALGTPPDEPKQLWYSKGATEKGSSNMIGFANKEIDEIIDQLQFEYNPEKRIELYHRFDRIIHELEPYTFLYTPKVMMIYREYLQNVFIPADRQDLIPGADMVEPQPSIYWLKMPAGNG